MPGRANLEVERTYEPGEDTFDRVARAISILLAGEDLREGATVPDPVTVSRRDWLHSVVACPSCGLHLDPVEDLDDKILDGLEMIGVRGTHRRCGAAFVLMFDRKPN